MRIHEIINESCEPGWQESEFYGAKNGGYTILSYRLGMDCEFDEILFVYYNKNLVIYDSENENGWIISVKVRDKRVIIYDYFSSGEKGRDVGEFSSVSQVITIFDKLTSQYIK